MVTANLDNVSSSFETIANERDLTSMAALAVAGAGGGILATELSDRILPMVGAEGRPSTGRGFAANGLFKALVAAGLAYAAISVGGTLGVALGIAGLGALVVAGADLVSMFQSVTLEGQQALKSRTTSNAGSITASNSNTPSVKARTTRVSSSNNTPDQNEVDFRSGHEAEVEFR